jgi:hypothetical protein
VLARPEIIEVLYYRTSQLFAPVTPVVMLRREMDIRSAQKQTWQNKVAKGFNTTDIPLEFCLLQERSPKMRRVRDLQPYVGREIEHSMPGEGAAKTSGRTGRHGDLPAGLRRDDWR